jgi:hypothetical protein
LRNLFVGIRILRAKPSVDMNVSKWLFVFLAALFSCQDDDKELISNKGVAEGYYEGWFSYRDRNYWCLIQFEEDRYEEWPSGGVMYQKSMACLTKGTYYSDGNKLVFNPGTLKHEGFPDQCVADTKLPGTYVLFNTGRQDSLVFAKGEGDSRIIYHVARMSGGGD